MYQIYTRQSCDSAVTARVTAQTKLKVFFRSSGAHCERVRFLAQLEKGMQKDL